MLVHPSMSLSRLVVAFSTVKCHVLNMECYNSQIPVSEIRSSVKVDPFVVLHYSLVPFGIAIR